MPKLRTTSYAKIVSEPEKRMMKYLNLAALWEQYSSLGVQENDDWQMIAKIKLMNRVYLVAALSFGIGTIISWVLHTKTPFLPLICTLFFILIPFLGYFNKNELGWKIGLLVSMLALTTASIIRPGCYALYSIYSCIIFLSIYLIGDDKKRQIRYLSFITVNLILFTFFSHQNMDRKSAFPLVLSLMIIFLALVVNYFIMLLYLSEKERKEQELAYAISLKEAALNATKDATLIVDITGEITGYNKKLLTLWEIENIEEYNTTTLILWVVNRVDNIKEAKEHFKLLAKNLNYSGLCMLYCKNHKVIEIHSQPQVLGKEIIGRVFNFRDVTKKYRADQKLKQRKQELKQLNEKLEQKVRIRTADLQAINAELQRSNTDLEQFAYIASHDLQEPLRMIGNFVQLLERQYSNKIDSEGKEYIHFIVNGVSRMSKLIHSLLRYSRVGRKELGLRLVDMNKIIEARLFHLNNLIKETETTITLPSIPHKIFCEPDQISLVFSNLLSNAIKFNEKVPTITIKLEEETDKYLFSIEDNGIGIDKKYTSKVFEIFNRLHRREEYEGTGIGLALCKKIIARHGGEIWFDSNPGTGSTFYFTISKELQKEALEYV